MLGPFCHAVATQAVDLGRKVGYHGEVPGADCEIHGPVGHWLVCEHLAAALHAGTAREFRECLEVFLACEDCFEQYGLARFEGLTYSAWTEDAQRAYDAVAARSDLWCHQCVLAVRLQVAREAGLPDPFRAFERTVTFLRRDVARKIEGDLRNTFTFRPSIHGPRGKTLLVRWGSLNIPLTITVYYVLDAETQDRIQACVERRLEESGLPEYHLLFMAAESWITLPDGGGYMGHETVIREVWGGGADAPPAPPPPA